MTKQQTIDSITGLTKSTYRYTSIVNGTYGVVSRSITVYESGLTYHEYYHDNGTLEYKGLSDLYSNPVGTWWFCDASGEVYKEFDYSTNRNIVYKDKSDPMQWMFDSIMHSAKRTCEQRYGKIFTQEHIFLSPFVTWYNKQSNDDFSGMFPLMPTVIPSGYQVQAEIRYDSIVVDRIYLWYDSLKLHDPEDYRDIPIKKSAFLVGYYEAALLSANHGYEQPSLFWSRNYGDFYWKAQKCEHTNDPYDDEDCSYKIISATTGKPIPSYMVDFTTDRPSTSFTEFCPDTFTIPSGYKDVSMEGASFIAPVDWLVYSFPGSNGYSYMTNGTDTIFGKSDCASWARMAYQVGTAFDTTSVKAFDSHFPDHSVQGRSYELEIVNTPNGLYDINFTLYESILAMRCSHITYEYTANGVNASTRDMMLKIFSSIHFFRCQP